MFKVTVLKAKDVIKIFGGISLTILIILLFSKNFRKTSEKNKFKNLEINLNSITNYSMTNCMDQVIPTMSEINKEYKEISQEDESEKSILKQMLKTQIASIKGMEEIELKAKKTAEEKTQEEQEQEQENKEEIELAKTGMQTQVITNNPISENANVQYGNVKIKNQTSYTLTEDILNPDITIENKNILLFHTHSCESYTPSEKYPYTQTGNFRTTDLNFTVTRLGTELENHLKQYNYNVVHSTDYHDYPAYNGSYTRSLATVENLLKTTPSDIIIDVHRDAIGSRPDYAPTVRIGETEEVAQMMFVIGTNEGGLWHPNWQQNLKFAVKVQQKAEEMYPGLFKPIMLTTSRYNQHAGKFASIIEVGSTGNTLDQCLNSMKYLAKVMDEVLKD